MEPLRRLIDTLSERIMLCTADGGLVHANPPLWRMLEADSDAAAIHVATARAVRSVRRPPVPSPAEEPPAPAAGEPQGTSRVIEAATARGRYSMRIVDLGTTLPGDARIMVVLEPLFEEPLSDAELRSLYHLTPREILVARYLGAGMANDGIARALAISPHTVRRHTEHILRKLDIISRAEVRSRITRGANALNGTRNGH